MAKIKFKITDWKFQTILVSIFYAVGVIGHYWEYTYQLMVMLTPYVLLISSIWAIHKCFKKKFVMLWILIAYIATFFLEVIGVATGLIFGPYYYGDVLGPKLLNVPVIIGLNWVVIIFSLVLFSEWLEIRLFNLRFNRKINILIAAAFTALFATLFDFILEPVAVGLNYWTWTLTSDPFNVPIQNYIAWFLISFSFAVTYLSIPENKRITLKESPHSPYFVLIQILFFIALRILLFS